MNMVNNKIQEFLNDKFGEVRAITKGEEIWFVAKDICDVLGTKTKDLRDILKNKGIGTIDILTNGGIQEMLCITEASLYRQIFKSRKPFAEEFQDWICEEVIPAIRKDGMYVNGEEEVESVEELNELISEAIERKILRKYGIGVRNDLTSIIDKKWTIKNKFQMATYTNELVYKPIFKAKASDLKNKYKVKKLRDDLFSEAELTKVANIEKEVALLIDFGQDYYTIKDYVNKKYA